MAMGFEEAISWWNDIGRFGEGTSNKLKMVLVGLPEAGKTTVVRNITGRAVPNKLDRTVGIEITEGWKPDDGGMLEVSIWDFAGQADYFASHQIFVTEGSLFLLVVDLQALFVEATSGAKQGGDPNGRVYRWLEMLHLRVPGAAVALVGTHRDAAEFNDSANLQMAINHFEQLIARYNKDKAKEAANIEAMQGFPLGARERHANIVREVRVPGEVQVPAEEPVPSKKTANRSNVAGRSSKMPIIHGKIFMTSVNRDSTRELVDWVGKAATLLECPAEFHFPAVRAKIPTAWIDANHAMAGLKAGGAGKRYVTWREAVETFSYFMETKGTPLPDPHEILLRAMRHREAEGGVLLSLHGSIESVGGMTGMLYLDPTWLIELVRRLTDHNLVDPEHQGAVKKELERYGEEHTPPLELNMLWKQHRSYRASGTLDLAYLRFLWLYRQLDANEVKLDLSLDDFNSVLATMEALLVLHRAPATEGTTRALYVVPSRLPEYGDEQLLEKGDMGLGDIVVRVRCSFRRSYAPPAIIGRFLAFSNAHIMEAKECWQHGAHVIWTPGAHDVLVYETHSVETIGDDSVAYPELVMCVKGNTPAVREVLASLTEEVTRLFESKAHGYPGLCSVVFEDTDVVHVRDLTSDLRKYLDNRFEQLGATVRKVAGETSKVLQAVYLAAEEENQYPRLLLLKTETNLQPEEAKSSPTPGSSQTDCETGDDETNSPAAGMQREIWNKWIRAFRGLKEGRKVRMVFICEHDMTEVECGPDGKGYLIEKLPQWVESCLPVLETTLFAVRVAVGAVSHVDLPLNDLLAAVVKSASTEALGAMRTNVSASGPTGGDNPLFDASKGGVYQPPSERLQKEGYLALCQFMQRMESPSTACCGARFQCPSCGSTRSGDCVCVSWREGMVRVPNGKGGLVWVKKVNEVAYAEKIARENAMSGNGPHA